MPITIKHGSIFDSTAQVLVCPVNCVGVMGKGLAKEFKRRFPVISQLYIQRAKLGHVRIGSGYLFTGDVLFFPTKDHWRNSSRLEWVDAGLYWLAIRNDIKSIALPQLGCGCGGLDWADVWPLYEKHLGGLDTDVEVWIYE